MSGAYGCLLAGSRQPADGDDRGHGHGQGESEETATIKIEYQINGKWEVAHETDITVDDKGAWMTDCKPPVPTGGSWPVADGPNPTPYRLGVYEGKTLKASTAFGVVNSKKKKP